MSFQYTITAGPSKYDFQAALFDGKKVRFTLDGIPPLSYGGHIFLAEASDSTRENWSFRGVFRMVGGSMEEGVRGFYSTKTRSGRLDFTGD